MINLRAKAVSSRLDRFVKLLLIVTVIFFLYVIYLSTQTPPIPPVPRQVHEKSTYEKNMDFARELDKMEKARALDEIEEEQRAVDKYRK